MKCKCEHSLSHHIPEEMWCVDCDCKKYKEQEAIYEL